MSGEAFQRRYATTGTGITAKPVSRSGDSIATVGGYACVWDEPSHDMGGWTEVVKRGAFTEALRASLHPILALYSHTVEHLLGNVNAGTLRLEEDRIGLRFAVDLPPTTIGHDVLALVKRGDLAGCSFGFVMGRGNTWEKTRGGGARNVIHRVKSLREVSLVALPAYPATIGHLAIKTRATTPAQARAHAAAENLRRVMAASR